MPNKPSSSQVIQTANGVYNNNPYSGPATPTEYVSTWNTYTNLTPAQVTWFQAQPEDLLIYCINRHGYYLMQVAPKVTVSEAPTLIAALATEAQNTVNGIAATPATITTRAQIDAALSAIVP